MKWSVDRKMQIALESFNTIRLPIDERSVKVQNARMNQHGPQFISSGSQN